MVEDYATLLFEAHSTDYQTPHALRQLVVDHFAILKVGPALTFALREALFALAAIEEEIVPAKILFGITHGTGKTSCSIVRNTGKATTTAMATHGG